MILSKRKKDWRKAGTRIVALLMMLVFIGSPISQAATGQEKVTIWLNMKGFSLLVGDFHTLILHGAQPNQVKWSSSRPGVASVTQQGRVTAKKCGKTVIKVKYKKQVAKCQVSVRADVVKTNTFRASDRLLLVNKKDMANYKSQQGMCTDEDGNVFIFRNKGDGNTRLYQIKNETGTVQGLITQLIEEPTPEPKQPTLEPSNTPTATESATPSVAPKETQVVTATAIVSGGVAQKKMETIEPTVETETKLPESHKPMETNLPETSKPLEKEEPNVPETGNPAEKEEPNVPGTSNPTEKEETNVPKTSKPTEDVETPNPATEGAISGVTETAKPATDAAIVQETQTPVPVTEGVITAQPATEDAISEKKTTFMDQALVGTYSCLGHANDATYKGDSSRTGKGLYVVTEKGSGSSSKPAVVLLSKKTVVDKATGTEKETYQKTAAFDVRVPYVSKYGDKTYKGTKKIAVSSIAYDSASKYFILRETGLDQYYVGYFKNKSGGRGSFVAKGSFRLQNTINMGNLDFYSRQGITYRQGTLYVCKSGQMNDVRNNSLILQYDLGSLKKYKNKKGSRIQLSKQKILISSVSKSKRYELDYKKGNKDQYKFELEGIDFIGKKLIFVTNERAAESGSKVKTGLYAEK